MATSSPSSLPPIFSLPYHIRKRVYVFAGLIRECPVTLVPREQAGLFYGPRELPLVHTCAFDFRRRWLPGCVSHGHDPACLCPEFPKQLLLVCKFLHHEVQQILYGEINFVLSRQGNADHLKVIRMLSNEALCYLRHLLVRLNSWPCVRGHSNATSEACMICPDGFSLRDSEVSVGDENSERVVDEWEAICEVLSHIPPNRLHLELICDVGQPEMARRILEPMNSIPRLKGCTIRFGRKPHHALRSLARETATCLTATRGNIQPFRFSELPRELRLRVLWHTNLGLGGSFNPKYSTIVVVRGKYDHRAVGGSHSSHAIRTCCLECSFTKLHCSCNPKYASYSPYCRCRPLPLELFLVSRQLSKDASEVLYSTNTFRFAHDFSHTINMLSNIPPDSLKRLRCVEFNFDWSKNWDTNKSEWRRLLWLMADHCRHSRLFIKITVDTMDSEAARMTEEEEDRDSFMRMCYASYVDIARSIKQSGLVLQDFHLFLPLFWDLEPVLERYIMGPDYDSKKGNRYPKPGHSSDLYGPEHPFYCAVPKWHKDL